MRVGLVCPYDLSRPGGVQNQVLGLAGELRSVGDDVLVIGPGLPEGENGVDLGPTVVIPGNGSKVPISLDPRVLSALRSAARKVDLFHVHEPLMPVISLAALRAGTPVVATFHAAPGEFGTRFYNLIGSGVRNLLGGNVRAVTAVSETARAPLPSAMDVEIVPNGLTVGSLRSKVTRDQLQVSFLGRDERRKGLDVLLAAWPGILSESPGARLVVMGSDRGTPGIDWRGLVNDDEKTRVLNSSSVFVAPNLGGESFGIVVVEAMAAGTVVVASDIPAFRDVGGDAVVYFVPGDPTDLAETVVRLLADQRQRDELASAAIEQAAQFDWGLVAGSYRAVYERSLS
ncbi:MAG: glycosyltransferase family 4 protein [Acidimicrobiia bacterium]